MLGMLSTGCFHVSGRLSSFAWFHIPCLCWLLLVVGELFSTMPLLLLLFLLLTLLLLLLLFVLLLLLLVSVSVSVVVATIVAEVIVLFGCVTRAESKHCSNDAKP